MASGRRALLVLEDGRVFKGRAFASQGETLGEVVFNTSMTGYQEALTDPSYHEQILTMTYPLIGTYGINDEDNESSRVQVAGFVVKEYQSVPSNWRSKKTLRTFLEEHGVIGIEGIDTRALTRHIRLAGAMKGIISTETDNVAELLEKVREYPGLVGRDITKKVACQSPYVWQDDSPVPSNQWQDPNHPYKVVALDFGIKYNIIRELTKAGCQVLVMPGSTPASDILALQPDGVFLSNGPGDPAPVTYGISVVRDLLGKVPVFGICLGHQLLGLAVGARTFKLKFGHRGSNQPVLNLSNGRIEITSQNHGFCVDVESLPSDKAETTHINLNDRTSEGMKLRDVPAFSVQYHPEAAPGPHDALYLFKEFKKLIDDWRGRPVVARTV
ncbi:MAG TPA: carbamoyl-phosphate synthase small subunit [Deltaproteobacteria bacterium]|nr:carbamoyl-phosphate synthase small subunit [Deltaproteobacteria bacterium]